MLKFKFALDTIFSQLSSYPQVHVTFCSITGKLLETLLVAFFGLLISLFFFDVLTVYINQLVCLLLKLIVANQQGVSLFN